MTSMFNRNKCKVFIIYIVFNSFVFYFMFVVAEENKSTAYSNISNYCGVEIYWTMFSHVDSDFYQVLVCTVWSFCMSK